MRLPVKASLSYHLYMRGEGRVIMVTTDKVRINGWWSLEDSADWLGELLAQAERETGYPSPGGAAGALLRIRRRESVSYLAASLAAVEEALAFFARAGLRDTTLLVYYPDVVGEAWSWSPGNV